MEKVLADAFLNFYQTMLKPEFDALKEKNAEHDLRFSEMIGHFDSIYNRLGRLEDELLMVNSRLSRIEDSIELGNLRHLDLEKRVKGIKEQINLLQNRLEIVERHLNIS